MRAWAEEKGATDFAAVGELAKMIRLDLKQYLVCKMIRQNILMARHMLGILHDCQDVLSS